MKLLSKRNITNKYGNEIFQTIIVIAIVCAFVITIVFAFSKSLKKTSKFVVDDLSKKSVNVVEDAISTKQTQINSNK